MRSHCQVLLFRGNLSCLNILGGVQMVFSPRFCYRTIICLFAAQSIFPEATAHNVTYLPFLIFTVLQEPLPQAKLKKESSKH